MFEHLCIDRMCQHNPTNGYKNTMQSGREKSNYYKL
jgi:hypothetical protein